MRHFKMFLLIAGMITSTASAEILISFDSGALPSEVGWTYESQCFPNFPGGTNLTEGDAVNISDGLLKIDTTVPATTAVNAFYSMPDIIDPSLDLLFEARLRVLSVEPPPPSTTQAFSMHLIFGNFLHLLQVTEDEVRGLHSSSPGFPVDTSAFHTYSIFVPAGQQHYYIFLDGQPVLRLERDPISLPINELVFGDGTCQSRNGNVEIDFIYFKQFDGLCKLCSEHFCSR